MESSDIIALLALIISAFTFYWTALRNKAGLHLVRIDKISFMFSPEFALINSGNTDILVTSVMCMFEITDGSGWMSPGGQLINNGASSFTIQAKKTHHCIVEFTNSFDEDFVKSGEYRKNGDFELYHRDMLVTVEWVDSKGKEYKADSKIANIGFHINGKMHHFKPLQKLHNLYKKTPNKSLQQIAKKLRFFTPG